MNPLLPSVNSFHYESKIDSKYSDISLESLPRSFSAMSIMSNASIDRLGSADGGDLPFATSFSCNDISSLKPTHFIVNEKIEIIVEKCSNILSSMPNIKMTINKKNVSSIECTAFDSLNTATIAAKFSSIKSSTIVQFLRQKGDAVLFASIYEYIQNKFLPHHSLSSIDEFLKETKKICLHNKRCASDYLTELTKEDLQREDIRCAIDRLGKVNDPIVQHNLSLIL